MPPVPILILIFILISAVAIRISQYRASRGIVLDSTKYN